MVRAADIVESIEDSLAQAERFEDPYPHTIFRRPFSDGLYAEMMANLPDDSFYVDLPHPDTRREDGSSRRRQLSLNEAGTAALPPPLNGFWRELGEILRSDEVISCFARHMERELTEKYQAPLGGFPCHSAPRLFRDADGYRITPHPDGPKRVMTILVYFPTSPDQEACGTSIYRKREDGAFDLVRTVPFAANTGMCFTPTDRSWHGAEPMQLTTVRQSLALSCFNAPTAF